MRVQNLDSKYKIEIVLWDWNIDPEIQLLAIVSGMIKLSFTTVCCKLDETIVNFANAGINHIEFKWCMNRLAKSIWTNSKKKSASQTGILNELTWMRTSNWDTTALERWFCAYASNKVWIAALFTIVECIRIFQGTILKF